jgi:hypothetical protein
VYAHWARRIFTSLRRNSISAALGWRPLSLLTSACGLPESPPVTPAAARLRLKTTYD